MRFLYTMPLLVMGACMPAVQTANDAQPELAGAPELNAELLVSTDSLARRIGSDSALVLLHVARSRAAYDSAHVPGARFLPLGAIVVERAGVPNELPALGRLDSIFESAGVSDDSRVVVYGDLGGLSAGRAFFTLEYLGHRSVALLDGGLDRWRAEGRAVSREPTSPARGMLTPRPVAERIVSADWIRKQLENPAVLLLDARPPAEYTGAEPGAGVPRGGHIPGAANLFWREALRPDGTLRDPETLRAMFEERGASRGHTVVTYCRTGVQASHAYFVSRYLGYLTRMYDGSFIEWSRDPALPVEAGSDAAMRRR